MKIVTKEEGEAHQAAVTRGGLIGGAAGFGLGLAAVLAASRRYSTFRALTPQFRVFLVSSSTTAGAIVMAERASVDFGRSRDPRAGYVDAAQRATDKARASESSLQRAMDWGRENRYTIVLASWVAAMTTSFAIVGRNKYLTTAQKVVQARVYAQGLTLAVLILSALLEMTDASKGEGRWEKVRVIDPKDPTHKHMIEKMVHVDGVHKEAYPGEDLWKDMVVAEERRLEQQKKERAARAERELADKEKAAASSPLKTSD